jgi:hypothetical protein
MTTTTQLGLLLGLGLAVAMGLAMRPASADSDNRKGTATCHSTTAQLWCQENITQNKGREECYNDAKAYKYHWRSNGPSCFAINNGDVQWP